MASLVAYATGAPHHLYYRYFDLEIDPTVKVPSLPTNFYRMFKEELGTMLKFVDPYGNVTIVLLKKGWLRGYLDHGYNHLIDHYHLFYGGWLKVYYSGQDTFYIRVRDIAFQRVPYPHGIFPLIPDDPYVKDFFQSPYFDPYPEIMESNDFFDFLDPTMLDQNNQHIGFVHNETNIGTNNVPQVNVHSGIAQGASTFHPILLIDSESEPSNELGYGQSVVPDSQATTTDVVVLPAIMLDPGIATISEVNNSATVVDNLSSTGDVKNVGGSDEKIVDIVAGDFDIVKVDLDIDVNNNADLNEIHVDEVDNEDCDDGDLIYVDKDGREFFACEKKITQAQAIGSAVILPRRFSRCAFPKRLHDIKLHDANGRTYAATLRFSEKSAKDLYIGRGWHSFVKDNHVKGGDMLRLRVPVNDESMVYAEIL